jgi:hypothetical protein
VAVQAREAHAQDRAVRRQLGSRLVERGAAVAAREGPQQGRRRILAVTGDAMS